MKTRETISIIVAAAKQGANGTAPEKTNQIRDGCTIVAALPNEPINKSDMTVQLFASIPVGDRMSTLARLNALMHPGPTSQETSCGPLNAGRDSAAR